NADFTLDLNRAMVGFDGPMHDGETEARTFDVSHIRSAEEGFKQAHLLVLRNADAAIPDFDDHFIGRTLHAERNRSTVWRILGGIADDVAYGLLKQLAVDLRRAERPFADNVE